VHIVPLPDASEPDDRRFLYSHSYFAESSEFKEHLTNLVFNDLGKWTPNIIREVVDFKKI
jgi:hypothetical protein